MKLSLKNLKFNEAMSEEMLMVGNGATMNAKALDFTKYAMEHMV